MLIAHRLVALSTVGVLALGAVGGVGVYGIHGIRLQLERLTRETLPVQSAVLELQAGKERTLARLLALSHAANDADALVLGRGVHVELDELARAADHVRRLSDSLPDDIDVFRRTADDVGDTVDARLADELAFERAAIDARTGLEGVASRVAAIGTGVRAIVDGAGEAATLARERADTLTGLQRATRHVDSLLGELVILIYATDALTSKYKLAPIEERFVAGADALQRIMDEPATSARLGDVVPPVDELRVAFTDAADGLFATRMGVLDARNGGGNRGSRKAYRNARKALAGRVETARRDIRPLIDDLALEVVVQRRAVDAALELSGDPASVTALTSRLLLGERTLGVGLENLLLSDTPERLASTREAARRELDALASRTARLGDTLEAAGHSELVALAAAVESDVDAIGTSLDRVADGLGGVLASDAALTRSLADLERVADAQRENGRVLLGRITAEVENASAEVDGEVWLATSLIAGLGLVAALVSILVSGLVTRSILGRLRQAMAVAEAVSHGRLEPVPPSRSNDEVSRVLDAMGTMVGVLDDSVRKIRGATHRVNADAEEISDGNAALSERTERQAARLAETAESTARISEALKEDAAVSGKASELVEGASEVAGRGRSAVRDAMESMEKVQGGAHEISNITAVIDNIAFQTNILALNAAVEASRAGESGRGFSVVASEVRLLAQKSKESAHQIKEIIDGNVRDVETGTALVREAGRHINDVAINVDEVATLIADVSASSREQVESISRIDGSVGELTRSTSDNAALSEQLRHAAVSMLEQSRSLDDAVSVFALGDDEPRGEASRSPSISSGTPAASGASLAPVSPNASRSRPTSIPPNAPVSPVPSSGIETLPEDVPRKAA